MKVIRLRVTDQANDKEEIFSLNESSSEPCNLSRSRYFTLFIKDFQNSWSIFWSIDLIQRALHSSLKHTQNDPLVSIIILEA